MRKWLIIGVTCLALVITGLLVISEEPSQKTKAEETQATFKGVDLDCKGCQAKVEEALSNIVGIESYKLQPDSQAITVAFDPDVMKAEWIEKSLEAAGFKAISIQD